MSKITDKYELTEEEKTEHFGSMITQYRDKFRPRFQIPSPMAIHQSEDDHETGRHNCFDKSTYFKHTDIGWVRDKVKHIKLICHIINEYKQAHLRTKKVTEERIFKILKWVFSNPEKILVIRSKDQDYNAIKAIFENLEEMNVLHIFRSHRDVTFSTGKHTEGLTTKQMFEQGFVDNIEYYSTGVIATYQITDKLLPKNKQPKY